MTPGFGRASSPGRHALIVALPADPTHQDLCDPFPVRPVGNPKVDVLGARYSGRSAEITDLGGRIGWRRCLRAKARSYPVRIVMEGGGRATRSTHIAGNVRRRSPGRVAFALGAGFRLGGPSFPPATTRPRRRTCHVVLLRAPTHPARSEHHGRQPTVQHGLRPLRLLPGQGEDPGLRRAYPSGC
jgi:hypothetical protein